ncbi:unnamed protein product [Paramecium octaurelia]|uniref:Uncharacterized protein n=1 Tax=Paramecium octaurelia TaxID=43137 RepID=A0A8S1T4N2_PAROT|nr:unnamed protein product [Paramecium octaurelia]
MGNIEMKEEAITTQQECYHCKGIGFVTPKFSRKYLDQDLSPTQKRERDQCLDCLGKGHLTLEHYDEKNFTL